MSKASRQKQRIWLLAALVVLTYFASFYQNEHKPHHPEPVTVAKLFQQHKSGVQVQASGVVSKILPDDTKGSRHQRFILQLADGMTVLIAHNIDLAPRLEGLKVGDDVTVFGEYEWNKKGGIIHWTHHDPDNRHVHGWIKWHNQLIQ